MLLDKKIKDKTAKIAVVGLGYVGLPLAIEFVKAGFDVLGIDVDKKKVNSINNGENYIKDIDDITLRDAVDCNSLNASCSITSTLAFTGYKIFSSNLSHTPSSVSTFI